VADVAKPAGLRKLRRRLADSRAERGGDNGPVTATRFVAVDAAREVLSRTQVGIFIVAYQAERFIESVLMRIPAGLADSELRRDNRRASPTDRPRSQTGAQPASSVRRSWR
jgi:hypothetical protein